MPDLTTPLKRRRSPNRGELGYNLVVGSILLIAVLSILYPLYFILIASVSEPAAVANGQALLWPSGFNLDGYARLLSDDAVWRGLGNSVLYTTVATAISVSVTVCAAYALSRKNLPGRWLFVGLFGVTMFFDGGIIPRYLVVKDLDMLNTIWALVLPNAVAVTNLFIAMTFFMTTLPKELYEAAQLDGASELGFFTRIVLPLAKPIIAVLTLIHVVWNWNAFFDALIFLSDEAKYPLQLVLRTILVQSEVSAQGSMTSDMASYAESQRLAELIKYAMVVISTIPLLAFSPFAQKHLSKGGIAGAMKG